MYQESETVELKESVIEGIKKEVVAFANTNGGKIYVGIADEGKVVGVGSVDDVIQQVANMVRDAIKPDVTMFVHYAVEEENEKKIVAVDVARGTNRPYYLARKGLRPEGVYVRQGTSSVPASVDAIRQMIKETDGDSFEMMRSLQQELTFSYAEKEFMKRNLDFSQPQRKTLKLCIEDGVFTNLAYLLSDQCAHTVKIAVFQGVDQSVFKDRREFSGSLLQQLNEAYSYIDLFNSTSATFNGLLRSDTRAYPEVALREALLNSLVHRDYSFSASTLISVYEDRIEFVSIGGLVHGIGIEDILIGVSVCRNPQLANVFYRLRLIEAYGTGMKKIFSAYKGMQVQPQVESSANAFKIILPNLRQIQAKNVPARSEPDSASRSVLEDLLHTELNHVYQDREEVILQIAADRGGITRAVAEKVLGVSGSTASRLLHEMAKRGILVRIGAARNTKYVLP